jgi:hypothetical protein
MLPWSEFQETILKEHVVIDKQTGHRIPTVEAAVVAKYAALISPQRDWDKKQQDAVDLRRMIRPNADVLSRERLQALAGEVCENGSTDIIRFVELAIAQQPFPI